MGDAMGDLENSIASMRMVVQAATGLTFNSGQCHKLSHICAVKMEIVKKKVADARVTATGMGALEPALYEFYRVVSEAERFVKDCLDTRRDWKSKAFGLIRSRDGVIVHLYGVVWSFFTLITVLERIMENTADDLQNKVNCNQHERKYDGRWIRREIFEAEFKDDECMSLGEKVHSEEQDTQQVLDAVEKMLGIESSRCCVAYPSKLRYLDFLSRSFTSYYEQQASEDSELPAELWIDFDDLRVGKLVGRGSYARVYEVQFYEARFAMKKFDPGCEFGYIKKEVLNLFQLNHPNIVRFIGCSKIQKEDSYAIIMELLPMTLSRLIEDRKENAGANTGPFSISVALDIMLQIAKGMKYVHGLGMMHRDLKPGNVLVQLSDIDKFSREGYGRYKVADFGTSKLKHNLTSVFTTLSVGTKQYRAPEVYRVNEDTEDQEKYTKKADVFSFSMVCYEILSGNRPFDGNMGASDIHERIISGERPGVPDGCPAFLRSYLMRCSHTEAGKRPSFSEICRTLNHFRSAVLRMKLPWSPTIPDGLRLHRIEDAVVRKLGPSWCEKTSWHEDPAELFYEMFVFYVVERKFVEQ